jgi:hypothetical protein
MDLGGITVKDILFMPPHAQKDVVYRQHGNVIRQLDSIIMSSRDFETVDRRVKAATWPENVLQISLSPRGRNAAPNRSASPASTTPAYARTTWTNLRAVVRDGSGYGTALTADGYRELRIVDSSRPCESGDTIGYTIYLEE